jgi:glycosyltransferase involved in cell wall biosynthesis
MPVSPDPAPSIAIVLDRYPALDQPFVPQIIKGLEERGLAFEIWTLRRGKPEQSHPVHAEVAARVRELPSSIGADAVAVAAGMIRAMLSGRLFPAAGIWLRALLRHPTPGTLRQLGQAVVLQATAPRGVRFIHAFGFGDAASVARLAARLMGIGWGCQAGERDAGQRSEADLADLLAEATFCLAASEPLAARLRPHLPGRDRVGVLAPAIDLSRFPAPAEPPSHRVGGSKDLAVRLVSIGRLEDGEGYLDLLKALSDMPKATHWRLTHIGEGALASKVRQFALDLGLGPAVIWKGPRDQSEVLAALREADIYVQAPRPSKGKAQPGLSHCLLEAASQRLPVVSTRIPGASGFLIADENALIVKPGQVAALTEAIHHLARDPAERARLGAAGRMRVELAHGLGSALDDLARRLSRAAA